MADAPAPVVRQPAPQPPAIPQEFQRAADLVNALFYDKDVGAAVRKRAKEKFPDIRLPDEQIDPVLEPFKNELAEIKKTLAEEREARAKEKTEAEEGKSKRSLQDALEAARSSRNLTDEGFDKMVARMKETQNFTDAEAAADWVLAREPPPKAPGPSWAPQALDMQGTMDKERVKLLHQDPEAYRDAEIAEFLKDPDKYTRETSIRVV